MPAGTGPGRTPLLVGAAAALAISFVLAVVVGQRIEDGQFDMGLELIAWFRDGAMAAALGLFIWAVLRRED